jgi:hypothetical protein
MRASEAVRFTGLSGTQNGAEFTLFGGTYQVTALASAWNGGSVELFQIGPDNSTWLSVNDGLIQNGGDTFFLPPGRFRWSITDASGVSLMVVRIPGE